MRQLTAGTKGDVNKEIEETGDYWFDEKDHVAALTEEGVHRVEKLVGVANLYDPEMLPLLHAVNQALIAHTLKKLDVEYVVKPGEDGKPEVLIVDEFTGRLMPGRRWSDGLHQAVEAKEGITVQSENQTLASITFQNYFRMYDKISGMTGTADTEAPEFAKIYDLDVLVIPTNRPMVRDDLADVVYKTKREKFDAVVEDIKERHAKGQPILVGTIAIETSEMFAAKLEARRHQAQRAERQAARARGRDRRAGRRQGRRHDLHQHGRPRHRHPARRQSGIPGARQVRPRPRAPRVPAVAGAFRGGVREGARRSRRGGRSPHHRHRAPREPAHRQPAARPFGPPGRSRARAASTCRSKTTCCASSAPSASPAGWSGSGLEEGEAIEHRWINKAIENAQKKVEARNFDIRKHLLEYDDVMNKQRQSFYGRRRVVLAREDVHDEVLEMIEGVLVAHARLALAREGRSRARAGRRRWRARSRCSSASASTRPRRRSPARRSTRTRVGRAILERLVAALDEKERRWDELREKYPQVNLITHRQLERDVVLRTLDRLWKEHLHGDGRAARRHPLPRLRPARSEGRVRARGLPGLRRDERAHRLRSAIEEIFKVWIDESRLADAARQIAAQAAPTPSQTAAAHAAETRARSAQPAPLGAPPRALGAPAPSSKVGRNDLCTCGSGKKYKRCCGPDRPAESRAPEPSTSRALLSPRP